MIYGSSIKVSIRIGHITLVSLFVSIENVLMMLVIDALQASRSPYIVIRISYSYISMQSK